MTCTRPCLIGALHALAADTSWSGRLIVVFQPAEELGKGARAMLADDFLARFGTPDVVLGQHVGPLPAGTLGVHPGPAFAASDSVQITMFGKGGHGSRPETTHDPVLMASSLVVRMQSIVSRSIAASDTAVVTVGSFHAGSAPNIIPDTAELALTIRTYDPRVRASVIEALERFAKAEAYAAGATRDPEIRFVESFPAVVNDVAACDRVKEGFARLPNVQVFDPGAVTGSEDVGLFAIEAGAPCAYWLLGGADPVLFRDLTTMPELMQMVASQPSNHSPFFAPVIEPTLAIGVDALVAAAKQWLVGPSQ